MMFVCKGAVVKDRSNVRGVVLAVDRVNKSVVIRKDSGGFTSCPLNMITVVSYEGAEPAGVPLQSAFSHDMMRF